MGDDMARIKYIRGDSPNSNSLFDQVNAPGYSLKRGKVVPDAKAVWGQTDANGNGHDPEKGKQVLDEALRD